MTARGNQLRIGILATAMAVGALANSSMAQTLQATPAATVAPTPAPSAFPGFSHPEISQCQTLNPGLRECVVPAHVAGRYVIEAAAIGEATGPGATLSMNIVVGDQICLAQVGAAFTGKSALHLFCEATLATDGPVKITVNFAVQNGKPLAAGPALVVRGLPWDGVLNLRGAQGAALQTAPAPAPAGGVRK